MVTRFRNEGKDTYFFMDKNVAYEGGSFCRILKEIIILS